MYSTLSCLIKMCLCFAHVIQCSAGSESLGVSKLKENMIEHQINIDVSTVLRFSLQVSIVLEGEQCLS